uniref:Aldehyde oxidase 5 n=1 Tax=Eptatretus burgeri TaxID=7764 RepID=A0A8C4R0T6_EPTBU
FIFHSIFCSYLLNSHFRNHLFHVVPELETVGLTGAKLACGEGGCGACTVMVSTCDPGSQHIRHYAVNSCLTPICSVHGKAVITTEGIGNSTTRLHPVQERIVKFNGSQCGFCTPGFVMSMYSLLRSNPEPNQQELSEAFQGNLCRCTGYRGIIEGYQTFCTSLLQVLKDLFKCIKCCFVFFQMKPLDPTQEPIFPPELLALANSPPVPLDFQGPRVRWLRPVTLEHLLQLKNRFPDARLVVGNTEVGQSLFNYGKFLKTLSVDIVKDILETDCACLSSPF